VTLTVIDDDGEFSTATIQLTVTEKPAESIIETVSEAIGTVPTAIIGGLAVIVVILGLFLVLTRRKGAPEMDSFSNFSSMPDGEPPAPVAAAPAYAAPEPQQDIYAQAAYTQQPAMTQEQMYAPPQSYAPEPAIAAKEDPFASLVATPEPVAQPVAAPAPAPVAQGPPLPATGLPEGWTLEQWNHYGAQYLAAQQGQQAIAQPTTTNTTPASANSDLSGLLDDFDL